MNTARPGNVHTLTDESAALLAAAQGGDMQAFAAVFEPMRSMLVRVAASIVGEADAEDVVMDALLRVWRALPAFRQRAALRTWTIRVVRNGALDALRRRARRREVSLENDGGGDGEPTAMDLPDPSAEHPRDRLGEAEVRTEVAEALAQLPPDHRQALELRYMAELSYAEIAAATGVSIGTVMSRLFYAKRKLARLLGRDGGDGRPRGKETRR